MGGIADKRRGLSEAEVLSLIGSYGLALATGAPANLAGSASPGVGTTAARADHVHRWPLKSLYSSGGAQALVPGDIGAAGRWSDELDGTVATVGAVTGVCGAVTVPSDHCLVITATVAGWRVAGPEGAGYVLVGTFRRTGGTVTQVGTTTVVAQHEDAGLAGAAAALVINGTNVECQVTGVGGANIDWRSKIVQKQSPN